MSVNDVLSEVNGVFRKVLDLPGLVIRAETTAKDVPEWDSLSHVQLVVAIEKHFHLRFSSREIQSFKNVGEMCEAIFEKRPK
jgi:acyl carrier protein